MIKKSIVLVFILTICQYVYSQDYPDSIFQDSITKKTFKLEEVTVSSTKELHKLKELPSSVSLISETKIEDNRIQSIKDLSSFIPNLFMPDYGSRLTSPIYIRGIGSKINSPSVGLYVDGVPYFEKACFDFDFTEIKSIEVLRGPQGTLYGRNTMGGIINIFTKSPENYTGSSLTVDIGEYGYKRFGASTYNKINDAISYSFSANYNHKGGFHFNEGTNEYADKMDSYNAATKVIVKHNKNFKTSFNINYQGSKQAGYPYGLYDKNTGEIADVNYDKYSSYDRDMISASIFNEYKTDNVILKSSTSYNYYDSRQEIDQDFSPVDLYFVNHNEYQNMLSQEFTVKSDNKRKYKWIVGAFGFYQSRLSVSDVEYGMPAIMGMIKRDPSLKGTTSYTYDKSYDIPTIGAALFHQSTLDLGKFALTAGIRFDYEHSELDYSYFTNINNVSRNMDNKSGKLEYIEIMPKVSTKYNINDNNFLYATVAKGYKAGGFNLSFEVLEHMSFDPEYSWNYEAGIKTSLLNKHLFINLAAFYINWENQQISQTVPSGRGRIQVNAGESESKGFEFESKAIIIDKLEINASYGYTHAKFIEYTDPKKDADYSGKYIPYIPKQTISIGMNYKQDINSKMLDAIKFNAMYKGFDEHYWDIENKVKQPYYFTIDSKISFIKNNFTFDIWGKNITNTEYMAYHFSSMGKDFAQTGKPSQVGVSLKYTF